MLLPTVSSGGKWSCRHIWEMLISPISPRNLRTTALLTSIYQLVSSNFHLYNGFLNRLTRWGTAHGLKLARRRICNPTSAIDCAAASPKYKNNALDMQSHTPLGALGPIEGGNLAQRPRPTRSVGMSQRRNASALKFL